jgi:antitoxin component YwqK of YwqJK toxin-antitoxin module
MTKFLVLILALLIIPYSQFSQEFNQVDDKGRKQGKWRKTYPSGAIRYEGQFRNDNPHGEFRYYYESTVLKAVSNYSTDGSIAYTKTFHENGVVMAEGKYVNRLKDSTWKYFSDVDGALIAEENYSHGNLEGKSITYYPDSGNTTEIIEYKNNIKDGVFLKYFPDGELMSEGTFSEGLLEGDFTVYFPDGNIEIKGKYKNGRKIGNWSYFTEDGRPISEDEFKEEAK